MADSKTQTREKFANQEYPIHIIGRHLEITDPIKSYAVDKLTKIDRFGGHVIEATIVMDVQKLVHTVDFIVNFNNTKIKVSGISENMYASIDQAIAHLQTKLRRYVRRLHEHKAKGLAEIDMNVNVIQGPVSSVDDVNDQIEEKNLTEIEEQFRPHEVVSRKKRPLKTLNKEEAVMKMELSEDHFMVYRSEEDQQLKVIYRRKDQRYGIIELPE